MPKHDLGVSYELRRACDRLNEVREKLREVNQRIDRRRKITSKLLDERDALVEIIRAIEDKYPMLKGCVNAHLKLCGACTGTGEVEDFARCDYCHGTRVLYSGGGCPADSTWGSDFVPATKESCHRCEGTGRRRMKRKKTCPKCEGHKVIIVRD